MYILTKRRDGAAIGLQPIGEIIVAKDAPRLLHMVNKEWQGQVQRVRVV